MHSFFVKQKILYCALAGTFFLYAVSVPVFAQDGNGDPVVTNVRIDRQGKINVFI